MCLFLLLLALTQGIKGTFVDISTTCVPLSDIPGVGLEDLCFTLKLDTCQTSFEMILTYGSDQWVDVNISDLSDVTTCNTIGVCETCFGVDDLPANNRSFILQPTFAQICPVITTTCPFLDPIVQPLDCVTLGIDCTESSSCGACVSTDGCGWCGSQGYSTQGSCQAQDITSPGPYCGTCAAPSIWRQTSSKCPTEEIGSESFVEKNKTALISGIILSTVLLAVGLVIAFICMRKRQARTVYAHQSSDMELNLEDGGALQNQPLSLQTDSSIDVMPSVNSQTSTGYVPPSVT